MKKILFALLLLQHLRICAQIDSANRIVIFLGDTTIKNTVTADFVATYELTIPEAFTYRAIEIDKTTTDSLCEEIGIYTIQLKKRLFKKAGFQKYKKTKEVDEPELKALLKQKKDLDAEIKRRIDEKKKGKT